MADDGAMGIAQKVLKRGSKNLAPLRTAIEKNSVRVAFAGHSFLENNNQNPRMAGLPYIFERRFREQFPEVDNPEFVNVSLGGRDAWHLAKTDYVGLANDNTPDTGFYRPPNGTLTNNGVWRTEDGTTLNGSVLGKSWMNTIKDLLPDVVVLMFDRNEDTLRNPCTDPLGLYPSMKFIIETMMAWPKRPTIVLGTSITSNIDRDLMLQCEQINRALARQYKLSLFNGMRQYEILTRSTDITNPEPHVEAGLRYDGSLGGSVAFNLNPTYWATLASDTTTATSPTGSTFRNSTGGSWHYFRKRKTTNCHMQVQWSASSTNPVMELYYRVIENTAFLNDDKYMVRLNGANVELGSYDQVTTPGSNKFRVITSAPLDTAVTSGQVYYVDLVAEGARHRIRINGKLMIDVYDFTHMRSGWLGFGQASNNQNAAVKVGTNFQDSFYMEFFDAKVAGDYTAYTDADMVGAVNDWSTNPDSLGGNTSVHLTTSAYGLVFDETVTTTLKDMRALMNL